MTGFIGNIEEQTLTNDNFRKVIFTGPHSQLVLMSLGPSEDIGLETHQDVDQFFRFEQGSGKVVINGEETPLADGVAVVVPAGAEHNVINTSSSEALKFYTIYSPAEHRDGVIHKTKADALADATDPS